MKKQLSHFGVHQTAKVFAFVYFILSLIFLIPLGILTLFTKEHEAAIMFFLLPFAYLIFGYLAWLLMGFIYNIVAKYFGGIEFDLVDKE
jgi:hypothetical protein